MCNLFDQVVSCHNLNDTQGQMSLGLQTFQRGAQGWSDITTHSQMMVYQEIIYASTFVN